MRLLGLQVALSVVVVVFDIFVLVGILLQGPRQMFLLCVWILSTMLGCVMVAFSAVLCFRSANNQASLSEALHIIVGISLILPAVHEVCSLLGFYLHW